jgi:hypothetical protein
MMEQKHSVLERTLPLFLSIITVVVLIFIAQLQLGVKRELQDLRERVATMQQAPVEAVEFEPFAPLEKNCTECHSERRFMGVHGSGDEISALINHMEMRPDVKLTPQEVDKIHASMSLLKCTKCHDETTLKQFSALNTAAQRSVLTRMTEKPGAGLSKADADAIQKSVQTLHGF